MALALGRSCPLAIAVGSEPGDSNLKFPTVETEFNSNRQETSNDFREESLDGKAGGL